MPRPLTVFLCSTYADLSEERDRVLDAVRRLQLQHDSMEFFGARANLPIETCLAEVRRSDVLVVVVGHRYGSFVPELGVSFSEAEYREGQRLGKPCLVYLRDENAPVLPKHFERDPDKLRLLERWKDTLSTRHTTATFSDPHKLAVQVAADLSRTIQALEEAERTRPDSTTQPANAVVAEIQALIDGAAERGIPHHSLVSAIRRAVADLVAAAGDRKPVVFLSHAHTDKPVVRQVAEGLKHHGIDVWMDEAELTHGDSLVNLIERGLDSADFVAFFLSKASVKSQWVRQELNMAISRQVSGDRGAIVLPILLEDAEIPALLRDVMYLDMRAGDVQAGVTKLVAAIQRRQLERLHTFETRKNRYFNPPADIPKLGRRLKDGRFADLLSQLQENETLFGLYRNQADALVATHLHSKERMDEMEGLYAPAKGFYALGITQANEGLNEGIPT
ncbi:TIR domain-containing protein [Billgrantia montanilacus]|uniref:TIR domain-containing protein n=1 Tax=Billgrantia montanilacus TaxID=2282305 RepID=A0A368TS48_9GAMM|nr:TIR domain-containing protein [Halomonas montanilacus]RCV86942.1 TIR domain-containing protein [Halomonas montanilacus]